MARLALKPDSSFFRKIAIGAVGARAVRADLAVHGHDVRELERGALETKIWKDVKRKRVRIPDLVCTRCGVRVESRAKTEPRLSMSHSDEEERAWSHGMVDSDWVAFPVCHPREKSWSVGRLDAQVSYWHERNWVSWGVSPHINYVPVGEFRRVPFTREKAKGVTEGSEAIVSWPAVFSTVDGRVESLDNGRIVIRPDAGSRRSRRLGELRPVVGIDQTVRRYQLVASTVTPVDGLPCRGRMPASHLDSLLSSRERTQRFAGVKLARLTGSTSHRDLVVELERDGEEDVYIRLEAAAFLVGVCHDDPEALFTPYLEGPDDQVRLEAVIALSETASEQAVRKLSSFLDDCSRPYFLRSAAAWGLGQAGGVAGAQHLVRAFADIALPIREEALEGMAGIGKEAISVLLAGLREVDESVAAGCAEALRRQGLPQECILDAARQIRSEAPPKWAVWLLGNLPREAVAPAIARLQDEIPSVHYALTLLWSFAESWVARRWELLPRAVYPDEA